MRTTRSLAGLVLACLVPAAARAHHVVWLDFSQFSLAAFSTVNGNTPPTPADAAAIQAQILANMAEDWALFDIYFTTFQPPNGRYSQVRFLPQTNTPYLGVSGNPCPVGGTCTGWGSWDDMTVSACEVYVNEFDARTPWQGANATTARIANGVSHVASHELAHLLDLRHKHGADDSITLGCSDSTCPALTADQNVTWHIMTLGNQWWPPMTSSLLASQDLFFSVHASRRILYGTLQPRNHWNLL